MAKLPSQVAVVDFHHARGPEVELWVMETGKQWNQQNDWNLLPFMALSDGAHASVEDFSYFTLLWKDPTSQRSTSLFGMSCSRQLSASRLKVKSPDVTRSTVQKAVVVLTDNPQQFGQLRESLSAVTNAWFSQEDFSNVEILKEYQGSLSNTLASTDESPYLGLSLRELVHEFRHQTLVLLKCLLLQRKMLFFGTRCERLCMIQFSLISLIPGLLGCLQDSASPDLDSHAQDTQKATSLKTSERSSLLAYMGLPLQLFGKGAFFGPYTPLQQLDILADYDTKSYVVGSTNSLLLQQKDKYSDLLVNLDETDSITINSTSLRTALVLSAADRRWIDFLTQTVNETWDPSNPSRPTTMGYSGSEEFIRLQFEEYILALLSTTAYHIHNESAPQSIPSSTIQTPADPPLDTPNITDFNPDFISAWRCTSNFTLFWYLTSGNLIFSIVEPRHPTAGALSIEDIQRRLAQQVAELHLDDRVREGREVLNKHLATGRERVNKLWADLEARRDAQRRTRNESPAPRASTERGENATDAVTSSSPAAASWTTALRDRAGKVQIQRPDTTQVQAAAKENAARAGAYLSSWGSWARERGKEWSENRRGSAGGSVGSDTASPGKGGAGEAVQAVDISRK